MRLEQVRPLYMAGKDVHEIAAAIEAPWPQVHLAIFDWVRAGKLPRRQKPEQAAA